MRRSAWPGAIRTTRSSNKFSNGSRTRLWTKVSRSPTNGSASNIRRAKPANAWASADEKSGQFARRQTAWLHSQPPATRGRLDLPAVFLAAQTQAAWVDGRGADRTGFSSDGPLRHRQRHARHCDEIVERQITQSSARRTGAPTLRRGKQRQRRAKRFAGHDRAGLSRREPAGL